MTIGSEYRPMDAADIRVGDVILFLGWPWLVHEIVPYDGPLADPEDGWRVARSAGGWGVTLIPGDRLDVARPESTS